MKLFKSYLVLWACLAACSSPRYTYYFAQPATPQVESEPVTVPTIESPDWNTLSASTGVKTELQSAQSVQPKVNKSRKVAEGPVIKASPKHKTANAPAASTKTNKDGKLGIIFFVAGVVVYLIGGPVFTVVGALSMMIGVIFGIKWLLRK